MKTLLVLAALLGTFFLALPVALAAPVFSASLAYVAISSGLAGFICKLAAYAAVVIAALASALALAVCTVHIWLLPAGFCAICGVFVYFFFTCP